MREVDFPPYFEKWFLGQVNEKCIICETEGYWELLYKEKKGERVGLVFKYVCQQCGLRAIQVFDGVPMRVLSWIWMDSDFLMEIDLMDDSYLVRNKVTYDIGLLMEKIGKQEDAKEVILKLWEEQDKRWKKK